MTFHSSTTKAIQQVPCTFLRLSAAHSVRVLSRPLLLGIYIMNDSLSYRNCCKPAAEISVGALRTSIKGGRISVMVLSKSRLSVPNTRILQQMSALDDTRPPRWRFMDWQRQARDILDEQSVQVRFSFLLSELVKCPFRTMLDHLLGASETGASKLEIFTMNKSLRCFSSLLWVYPYLTYHRRTPKDNPLHQIGVISNGSRKPGVFLRKMKDKQKDPFEERNRTGISM